LEQHQKTFHIKKTEKNTCLESNYFCTFFYFIDLKFNELSLKRNRFSKWANMWKLRTWYSELPETRSSFFGFKKWITQSETFRRGSQPFILQFVEVFFTLRDVFLGRFRGPIRVPRISNQVPRISEIGSLQIHTGYLTFSLKKNCVRSRWPRYDRANTIFNTEKQPQYVLM